MPTYTQNHDFQLFGDDEKPWEHRSDFENLDTKLEIRDSDANKTNYTPKSGAKFVATDTGNRYRGTGTTWEIMPAPKSGNGAITDGDGIDRQIWVIPAGGTAPAGASAEDIIFEREA